MKFAAGKKDVIAVTGAEIVQTGNGNGSVILKAAVGRGIKFATDILIPKINVRVDNVSTPIQ